MSSRSGRVVQYGRHSSTKRTTTLSLSPSPSPKRQKLIDTRVDDEQSAPNGPHRAQNVPQVSLDGTRAQKAPNHTYGARAKARASPSADSEPLVPTRPTTPIGSTSPSSSGHLTRTPSAKPKDLSGIFAPLSQLATSPSNSSAKSIRKRMLVRSRTEPSSPASRSPPVTIKPTLTPNASLPVVAAFPSQPDDSRSSPPSPSPTVSKSGLRTYSQSRSFLVALPAASTSHELSSDSASLGLPEDSTFEPDDELRESYTDLRTRWGVDRSDDDLYHTPGITNELMSITELRSKGESRRFLDEVGYLFEGLEEQSMTASVKRSSAVEIVLKMCDTEFVRKAKAADFIGRAWDALMQAGAGQGDKVLGPCLAFFVALVARDRRDVDDLARKDLFFEAMVRLLESGAEKDGLLALADADARTLGLTKAERVTLSNLRNIIVDKSNLFIFSFVPSTRLLVSYALSSVTPSSLPPLLLSPLLKSLLVDLAPLPSRIDAYASGLLPPPTERDAPDLEHIDHCLNILDAFLLGAWGRGLGRDQVDRQRQALGTGLVALCAITSVFESDVEWRSLTRRCLQSSLRVLINLSHTSAQWCRLLLDNPLTLPVIIPQILSQLNDWPAKRENDDEGGDDEARTLDRQCLALALLTNIVFGAEEAKDLIRDTNLDSTCTRARRCVRSCRCPGRVSAVECLTRLFVDTCSKAESSGGADLKFFQCHLAALVCLLTAASPANQRIVWQTLPGTGVDDKTDILSSNVQQFLEFYTNGGEFDGSGLMGDAGLEGSVANRVVCALQALRT